MATAKRPKQNFDPFMSGSTPQCRSLSAPSMDYTLAPTLFYTLLNISPTTPQEKGFYLCPTLGSTKMVGHCTGRKRGLYKLTSVLWSEWLTLSHYCGLTWIYDVPFPSWTCYAECVFLKLWMNSTKVLLSHYVSRKIFSKEELVQFHILSMLGLEMRYDFSARRCGHDVGSAIYISDMKGWEGLVVVPCICVSHSISCAMHPQSEYISRRGLHLVYETGSLVHYLCNTETICVRTRLM